MVAIFWYFCSINDSTHNSILDSTSNITNNSTLDSSLVSTLDSRWIFGPTLKPWCFNEWFVLIFLYYACKGNAGPDEMLLMQPRLRSCGSHISCCQICIVNSEVKSSLMIYFGVQNKCIMHTIWYALVCKMSVCMYYVICLGMENVCLYVLWYVICLGVQNECLYVLWNMLWCENEWLYVLWIMLWCAVMNSPKQLSGHCIMLELPKL